MDEQARRFREIARQENKGKPRRGFRYSRELRRVAVEYARARQADGASRAAVARALGVGEISLTRWLRASPTSRFRRVEVARGQAEWRSANLVLATPAGFRVEGLDVAMLVAVLRALS